MKTLIRSLVILAALSAPSLVHAQAVPTDSFEWTMEATSAATAQAYRFDLELDGATAPAPLATTCITAGADATCKAPIPAVTPGSHTARVRAVDISSPPPIFSSWSDPLTFTMRAVPTKPTGFRIVPAPGQ